MLKFFRKIRQQLAYDNNINKYSRYAIGEIFLVVIGILIALQINISYNNKELNSTVNGYLKQLREELKQNQRLVEYYNNIYKQNINQTNNYLELLNTKTPNAIGDTTIYRIVSRTGPTIWLPLESASLNDFNSSGLINKIKNDDLKRNVFRIEAYVNRYNLAKIELTETWNSQLLPYYLKHAVLMKMRDSIYNLKIPQTYIPLQRDAFINNQEFNNILINRMMMSRNAISSLDEIIEVFISLQEEITLYLSEYD